MRRVVLGLIVALAIGGMGLAQEQSEFQTMAVLERMDVPPRDRVRLAQELLGVPEVLPPRTEAITYALGDVRSFSVNDNLANVGQTVEAELYALGEHIAIWVDTRANGSRERSAGLAFQFDSVIYPKLRALWGTERTPGIDADTRVVALFTYGVNEGVAAYYASEHSLPRAVAPSSNEAEMMIYNLGAYGANFDSPDVFSVTAHEFQHMIRDNLDSNAETWLNEGMSVFTEWMIDYSATGLTFAEALFVPRTQLNTWYSSGANYGMAGLFVTYFYQRFGIAGSTALSQADGLGMALVDSALNDLGAGFDADMLYADFAAATWLQDTFTDLKWGYPTIEALFPPASRTVSGPFPATFERNSPPYALDYVKLPDAPRGSTLNITAEFDPAARLVPTDAASGTHLWMAVREDDSAPTLTHAFDLRGVTSAALDFKVWHDLETAYDFGYVIVSWDDGATGDVLETDATKGESLYGRGYTERSDGWLDESIALDAYAGQEILVRFMVITDDALNSPGMALDDIRIDAIGYAADAENDDGGWDAQGWIRTDNRVPARMWVQVLQERPGGVDVQRILSDGNDTLKALIFDDTLTVTLALSLTVPLSTENVAYSVTILPE